MPFCSPYQQFHLNSFPEVRHITITAQQQGLRFRGPTLCSTGFPPTTKVGTVRITKVGTLRTKVGTLRIKVGIVGTKVGIVRTKVGTDRTKLGTVQITKVGTVRTKQVGIGRTKVGAVRITKVGTVRTKQQVPIGRAKVGTACYGDQAGARPRP